MDKQGRERNSEWRSEEEVRVAMETKKKHPVRRKENLETEASRAHSISTKQEGHPVVCCSGAE